MPHTTAPRRALPAVLTALLALLVLGACAGQDAPSPAGDSPQATSPRNAESAAADVAPAEPDRAAEHMASDTPAVPPALERLLRADDTLASARARLGEAAVVAEEIHQAEGEMIPGWVLYPDDPARRIEVFLDDAGLHPVLLRVNGEDSQWVRADGIRIGSTSAELQALNGRPFAFYGFGWDYGGTVGDWRGGALDAGDTQGGYVRMSPPDDVPADYPLGDGTFDSDDPQMIAHPARVYEFSVPVTK